MTIVSTENDRARCCAVILTQGVRVLVCAGAQEEAAVFAGIITSGLLAGSGPSHLTRSLTMTPWSRPSATISARTGSMQPPAGGRGWPTRRS